MPHPASTSRALSAAGRPEGAALTEVGPREPPGRPSAGRLGELLQAPSGYVRMLRCVGCGHLAPVPAEALVRRFGPDAPMLPALRAVTCSACRRRGRAEAKLLRLCDPGCARYRG